MSLPVKVWSVQSRAGRTGASLAGVAVTRGPKRRQRLDGVCDEVTEGNEVMEKRERQEGITPGQAKGQTQRWQPLQPNLERVNEAARRSGQTRFTALLHHVDVAALERAFRRQRRAASPGIDRVKVEDYERNLEVNLQPLHARIHSGQYWPKPVRRTYIPKADGSLRPLGIRCR